MTQIAIVAAAPQLTDTTRDATNAAPTNTPLYTPINIQLGGINMPGLRNFVVTGSTGSGKTVAIRSIVKQLADAGHSLVVWDPTGEYAHQFCRADRDIKFNPTDASCAGWNVFNDIGDDAQAAEFAAMVLPLPAHPDNSTVYFTSNGRVVLTEAVKLLRARGETSNAALYSLLADTSQADLFDLLKNTPAGETLDPERRGCGGGGVLSTVLQQLKFLRFLPSGPLSLRELMTRPDTRVFITGMGAGVWVPLARAALATCYAGARAQGGGQLKHIVLDEFGMLVGGIAGLADALEDGRTPTIIGVQGLYQLERVFGRAELAELTAGPLQTVLALRCNDPDGQARCAELLAGTEPADFEDLPDCEGFLRFDGTVARVRYPVKEI